MRRCLLAVLPALLFAPAPVAGAEGDPVEQAREELGIAEGTRGLWPLPNGVLRISPADVLAAQPGAEIGFEITLDRAQPGAALVVELPAPFGRVSSAGVRTSRAPVAGRGDRIARAGRRVVVAFEGAERRYRFTIENVGLPAGRYALPLRWRDPGGRERRAITAEIGVLAGVRERARDQSAQWRELPARQAFNVTGADALDQQEAFVAVSPADPQRLAVAGNPSGVEESMSVHVFDPGSGGWLASALPEAVDAPAGAALEGADVCCDPMLAVSDSGDIWFGAVGLRDPRDPAEPVVTPSRILVNRIRAGETALRPVTTGLPTRGDGVQDKPMMAIDNWQLSPTYGRLYVVWSEPDASDPEGVNIVVSYCDTRSQPDPDAGAWCEDADNWSEPRDVTAGPGSYTSADVAAGPDGRVYVTWWDYSATNAIRGAVCAAPCEGSFGVPRTVALLDATAGLPLPFGCPILVQPGGRTGPVPGVEVDRNGRVWVSWADLRPDSGTTRCEAIFYPPDTYADGEPLYTAPAATHLSWDAFVASAPGGSLPGGSEPSRRVGTPLVVDGEEGMANPSDDFLPWLGIDASTRDAWVGLYSTGHDQTRRSAHFYAISVAPTLEGHLVGPANRVSVAPSSHASDEAEDCCLFQPDLGDYEGIAAIPTGAIPAWADNSPGDTDLFVYRGPLQTVGFDLLSLPYSESDGDGRIEPGETVVLRPRVRNTGTRFATGLSAPGPDAELTSAVAAVEVRPARTSLPALAPGATGEGAEPFEVRLDPRYECGRDLALRLGVTAAQGAETLDLALSVPCPPGVLPAPTPVPAPFVAGLVDLEVPGVQRVSTVRRRGVLAELLCAAACRVELTATLDAAWARRLRSPRRIAATTVQVAAGEPQRVRFRLTATARRRLARARRVVATIRASVANVSRGETASLGRRLVLRR